MIMFVGHFHVGVKVGCQGLLGYWGCYTLTQLCQHEEGPCTVV